MYEITVEDSFNASHALHLPDNTVEPSHGHDWRVTVALRAESLDDTGFVADFDSVRHELRSITSELNHTDLNQHPWLTNLNPTAEIVAKTIHDHLTRHPDWGTDVFSVTVVEAPGCTAKYAPNP